MSECLSSPEFLEHVTKVRPMASLSSFTIDCVRLNLTITTGCQKAAFLKNIKALTILHPGDGGDRCSCQPSWRPGFFGGLFVEPGQEAPSCWRQNPVLHCKYWRAPNMTVSAYKFSAWSYMIQCGAQMILFFNINNSNSSSSRSKEKFSQTSCLCWSGGRRGSALHDTVQSWNRIHSCTAPSLAQHVHYRGGCHDQRLGKERRTQVQLSSGRTQSKIYPKVGPDTTL